MLLSLQGSLSGREAGLGPSSNEHPLGQVVHETVFGPLNAIFPGKLGLGKEAPSALGLPRTSGGAGTPRIRGPGLVLHYRIWSQNTTPEDTCWWPREMKGKAGW